MPAQSRRHIPASADDPWGFGAPDGTLVDMRHDPAIAAPVRVIPTRREIQRTVVPELAALDLRAGGGIPRGVPHDPAGDARLRPDVPPETYPHYFRPRRRRSRLVRAVLVLGLVALAGGGVYLWILRAPATEIATPVSVGGSAVRHLPLDASPGPIVAPPSRPTPAPTSRATAARSPGPLVATPSTAPGFVIFDLPFDAQVYERGARLGSTQSGRLRVAPGTHTFTLVSRELDFNVQETVTVTSGQATNHVVEQYSGPFSVSAQPWAEVFISGRSFGETPLANISLPIGTYQVTLRHPTLGERDVAVTVRYGAANRLAVDMQP